MTEDERSIMSNVARTHMDNIRFWAPLIWYIAAGAGINAMVVILFGKEDFLQQYTGLVNYDWVALYVIPAFQGWAISLVPIATGLFIGYTMERKKETQSAKPLLVLSVLMTAFTALIIVLILLAPALFGWVAGMEGFELTSIMFFLILVILIFPLSFLGAFVGAVFVSY